MAGRPRKPTALHELSGELRRRPGRFAERRNEPKPEAGLGKAPARVQGVERELWDEISSALPAGVLTVADRWLVESLCRLKRKELEDRIRTGELSVMHSGFAKLGMNAVDRARINIRPEPVDPDLDPLDVLAPTRRIN